MTSRERMKGIDSQRNSDNASRQRNHSFSDPFKINQRSEFDIK